MSVQLVESSVFKVDEMTNLYKKKGIPVLTPPTPTPVVSAAPELRKWPVQGPGVFSWAFVSAGLGDVPGKVRASQAVVHFTFWGVGAHVLVVSAA